MPDPNWRTDPGIQRAKRAAKEAGAAAAMIIYAMPDGTFQGHSYGQDGPTCRLMGNCLDTVFDDLLDSRSSEALSAHLIAKRRDPADA